MPGDDRDGFVFPMRPSVPRALPPLPTEYLIQPKYDGWNIVIGGGHVWTRHGNEITDWCEDWGFGLTPAHPINGELLAVVDGEVGERTDIPGIRTGRTRPVVFTFDVMVEGPVLEERLAMVAEIAHGGLQAAPTTDLGPGATWDNVNREFNRARSLGHEGLLLKRRESLYHPSRETSILTEDWLKLKVRAEVSPQD